jgi:hypothetical protein
MRFKYSSGDVIGNLEVVGLGGVDHAGVRLYAVKCLLCESVTDKRLQTIQNAKSCGCMQRMRDSKVPGSGKKTPKGTRVEINTLLSIYKSNAKKRGVLFDLPYKSFESLVDGDCVFCGESGSNTLRKKNYKDYDYNGIDRINNNVGYVEGNCVTSCSWCNRAKNNGTLENFVDKCKKIASNIELDEGYFNIAKDRTESA